MKYILQYESFENKITKILLVDLYNEIEYHKLKWGNLQREYNEKFLFFNNMIYINEKNFLKILTLDAKDFIDLTIESFFEKNELEEFLI